MSDTPPLPPKSILTPGGPPEIFYVKRSKSLIPCLKIDRQIIAAVAEVEWRKRAERWRDYTWKCMNCFVYAEMWRAWGEKK